MMPFTVLLFGRDQPVVAADAFNIGLLSLLLVVGRGDYHCCCVFCYIITCHIAPAGLRSRNTD